MSSYAVTIAKMQKNLLKVRSYRVYHLMSGFRQLSTALPSKPLHTVALSDADTSSALAYVMHKLNLGNEPTSFTVEQEKCIERLGGRASDLETVSITFIYRIHTANNTCIKLVYKVRSGQPVEEAVEDIITRGVSELQKNIFGEDADDAKNLPWTREQAWVVVKRLAKADEVSLFNHLAVLMLMLHYRYHTKRCCLISHSKAMRMHSGIWNIPS